MYTTTASLTVSLRPYPRYARTSHTQKRYVKLETFFKSVKLTIMKTITICGSMKFFTEIEQLKKELDKKSF